MKTVAFALLTLAMAAGTAAAETRTIPVQDVRGLEVEGPFEVVVTRGAPSATLVGDANDLAKVGITTTGGGLKIWRKCTVFCSDRGFDVTLRVSSPNLAALDLSKGVEAKVTDSAAPQMAIDLSMGAALDITGACDTLRAKAAMGASLSASQLVCRAVDVEAAMGADVSVHATAAASAKAAMGASVEIAGHPPRVDSDAGLGGSIDAD